MLDYGIGIMLGRNEARSLHSFRVRSKGGDASLHPFYPGEISVAGDGGRCGFMSAITSN